MADIVATRSASRMSVDQYVTALRGTTREWVVAVARRPKPSGPDCGCDSSTGNDVSPELVDTADSLKLFAGPTLDTTTSRSQTWQP
ncbi:hypothetical protein C8039_01870 [Halogeometricum sp. wsp3]|nr:hypothetical protein C8039_01870 [Halogeometricum sp. wsp3]